MKFWDTEEPKEVFNYDEMKRKFIENLDYLKKCPLKNKHYTKSGWNGMRI